MTQQVRSSGKTQIKRTKVSAPMREVVKHLEQWPDGGTILHFGEGKSYYDTQELEKFGPVRPYDPNSGKESSRILPTERLDVGVAIYVFNTLPPFEREEAFKTLKALCEHWIIAVRCDHIAGRLYRDGVITSRGTFQKSYSVQQALDEFGGKGIIKKTNGYILLGG